MGRHSLASSDRPGKHEVAIRTRGRHQALSYASDLGPGSRGRRPARRWLMLRWSAAVAAIGVLAALSFTPAARHIDAADQQFTTTQNAFDSMHRTVSNGFGSADVGGTYTTSSPASKFSVSGDEGRIQGVSSGTSASASLQSVNSSDEQVQVSFVLPQLPSNGNGNWLSVELRRQSDGSTYRARLRVDASGRMALGFSEQRDGGERYLGPEISLPQRASAGSQLVVQGLAAGSSPVTLRARAWLSSTSQPDWQASYADSSPSRLVAHGGIGLWVYDSSTSPATAVTVTGLRGWALTPAGSPPSPAPPPSGPPASNTYGSVPVGAADYAIPDGSLFVSSSSGDDAASGTEDSPLRTIGAAVSRAHSNQTIILRAGLYHEELFLPPSKVLTIQSYPHEAAWMDGSTQVTNWTHSGSTWLHTGWDASFDHSASFTRGSNAGGFVNPAYPMAAYPDQVFSDGAQLSQVQPWQSPGPGQFSVDTAAHTIRIGSDPAGHDVRASDLSQALIASTAVTLRGIGIRRYATSLWQIGTVFLGGRAGGSRVENVVIDNNATQGLSIDSPDAVVDHVSATNNGMTGIHGNQADGSVFEHTLVAGNNAQRFNPTPSAAGIKITQTRGLTIRDNQVTDNNQVSGIWTDQSVVGFTIVGNVVRNGTPYGIETELSDTGIVAGNVVSGARYGYVAYDTGNVQVFNNEFSDNSVYDLGTVQDERREANPGIPAHDPRQPVPDPSCPWLTRNIVVADNVFDNGPTGSGAFQFYALDRNTHIPADAMHLTVDGNVFSARSSTSSPWMVGWGLSDNVHLLEFRTPAAFAAALKRGWVNMLAPSEPVTDSVLATDAANAVPLPQSVADALGQPAGTKHIGPF